MSNEKANSSKMKILNKWLNKLFGLNLIKCEDLDGLRNENESLRNGLAESAFIESLRNEIELLRDKINNLYLGNDSRCLVEFHLLGDEYMVYLVKDFYYIPIAKFPFTPNDADSRKYAKVCAEDLADALRDAEQYEPIK